MPVPSPCQKASRSASFSEVDRVQPRLEFETGPEAPVLHARQSPPARVLHDEAHLLRDVLHRVRRAVRRRFLPLHHGVEGPLVGKAPVREPRRIVAQAVDEGEDVPDRDEVPALVVFRSRRFRLKETRQAVREVADQHVAEIFRNDEVDGTVSGAPSDHERPGEQAVEVLDQPGVGGVSRVVDPSRFARREHGQQDLPRFFVQVVHALIDETGLEELVRDFPDQAGPGDHAGLHAEGKGDGFQVAHGQGGEVVLDDHGFISHSMANERFQRFEFQWLACKRTERTRSTICWRKAAGQVPWHPGTWHSL